MRNQRINKLSLNKNITVSTLALSVALVAIALNVITIARVNIIVGYSNNRALENAHTEYKLRKDVFCLKHGLADCFDQDIRDWNTKHDKVEQRFELLSGQEVTNRVQMPR